MSSKEPSNEAGKIPDHESPVRRITSDQRGQPYHALHSLQEARSHPDGIVVLEGDSGGQIYVVCPASLVKCTEERLQQLLRDLDAIAWPGEPPESARVYYERHPVGSGITGGMGGGEVTSDVWVQDEFVKLGLRPAIEDVIRGHRPRIRERPS